MRWLILITDKTDFKLKPVTRDNEGPYRVIKVLIHQEDIIIMNIYILLWSGWPPKIHVLKPNYQCDIRKWKYLRLDIHIQKRGWTLAYQNLSQNESKT
jgi:hypothetical protein